MAHCSDPAPTPSDAGSDRPDAASCTVSLTPSEAQHPAAGERVSFTARVSPPGAASELRFALVGDALDGSLSVTRASLAPDGTAVTELTAPSTSASFRVRASARCGSDAFVEVSVGERGFGMLLAEAVYRGARTPERLSVGLYRAMDCVSLSTAGPDRATEVPLPGGAVRFGELPAGIDYVVRGLALGAGGVELAAACAGPARVMANATARATLVFADAPLRLAPRYDLSLAFDLSSTAAASATRWLTPVTNDLTTAGGDAALLGNAVSLAVASAAAPETRDRDRAAFEAAWSGGLAATFSTQLARRDALVGPVFARVATSSGAVAAMVRARAVASVAIDDPARFTVDGVRFTLDPETPDVRGDDVEVPTTATARLRVAAGLGDTFSVDVDGFPVPWNALARSALNAWLSRQGVSSAGEYAAVSVCPVLVPIVREVAGRCDDACVTAACRGALTALGTRFESAVTTLEPLRSLVDLRFTGVPRASTGTLSVESLTGLATGGFREETSTSVAATTALARSDDP